jgi:cell division protein ZapA (FtsZ GTPase activity inhibitor)
MSAEPRSVRVTVLDEPFAIRAEVGADYTRQVAAHVDATLRSLRQASPTLEPFPTAVLGAMEITNDLFRARTNVASLAEEAIARVDRMVEAIDRTLEREASLTEETTR